MSGSSVVLHYSSSSAASLFSLQSSDLSLSKHRSSAPISFLVKKPIASIGISYSSSPSSRLGFRCQSLSSDRGGVGDGGGGSNGIRRGGGGGKEEGEGEPKGGNEKKMTAMSMSQKITLGYAALVGAGGVMGYLKSGSQKSLAAGGLSALALLFVYSQLPVRPAFASLVGLGLSAALLGVMGSRFMKSGKFFPAGIVSITSFIMAGGYIHGFFRGMHA